MGTRWPGHAHADEDGDVQLDALGVDRVHPLVVDRDLRVAPGREDLGADGPLGHGRLQVAHRLHAPVGVDAGAGHESVGVLAQGAARLAAGDVADHGLIDAVAIHLGQHEGDVVVLVVVGGDVLEHVLGRELELVLALAVADQGLEEGVPVLLGAVGNAQHQVHDADVGGHGHPPSIEQVLVSVARGPGPQADTPPIGRGVAHAGAGRETETLRDGGGARCRPAGRSAPPWRPGVRRRDAPDRREARPAVPRSRPRTRARWPGAGRPWPGAWSGLSAWWRRLVARWRSTWDWSTRCWSISMTLLIVVPSMGRAAVGP